MSTRQVSRTKLKLAAPTPTVKPTSKPTAPPRTLNLVRPDGREVFLRPGWLKGYVYIGKNKVPNPTLALLSPLESKVLNIIESYSYRKGHWYISDQNVAALAKVSLRAVHRVRRAFDALGIPLGVERGDGRGHDTRYERKPGHPCPPLDAVKADKGKQERRTREDQKGGQGGTVKADTGVCTEEGKARGQENRKTTSREEERRKGSKPPKRAKRATPGGVQLSNASSALEYGGPDLPPTPAEQAEADADEQRRTVHNRILARHLAAIALQILKQYGAEAGYRKQVEEILFQKLERFDLLDSSVEEVLLLALWVKQELDEQAGREFQMKMLSDFRWVLDKKMAPFLSNAEQERKAPDDYGRLDRAFEHWCEKLWDRVKRLDPEWTYDEDMEDSA